MDIKLEVQGEAGSKVKSYKFTYPGAWINLDLFNWINLGATWIGHWTDQ